MKGSQLEERIARRVASLVLADLRPLLGINSVDEVREPWKSEDLMKTPALGTGDAELSAKAREFGARWHQRQSKRAGSQSSASRSSNATR